MRIFKISDYNKQLMCYSCEDMSHLELCDTVKNVAMGKFVRRLIQAQVIAQNVAITITAMGVDAGMKTQDKNDDHCAMPAITCKPFPNARPLDRVINTSHAVSRNLNGWITHTSSLGVWIYRMKYIRNITLLNCSMCLDQLSGLCDDVSHERRSLECDTKWRKPRD
ncbi:hypothetical protein DPMN_141783 [Dreissena polymorpha]|uniref:Uncharacterized protein n=1 Tax=Dreissena polymorpha TaxID=45954 RepID=A0A9D4GDD7_DREPO|nr:hypothetical protein DPMN_141783 [Dreissena polymorpha]